MKVEEITIQVVVDGRRRRATFLRREKIASLLSDTSPLGEFLRALCATELN